MSRNVEETMSVSEDDSANEVEARPTEIPMPYEQLYHRLGKAHGGAFFCAWRGFLGSGSGAHH